MPWETWHFFIGLKWRDLFTSDGRSPLRAGFPKGSILPCRLSAYFRLPATAVEPTYPWRQFPFQPIKKIAKWRPFLNGRV